VSSYCPRSSLPATVLAWLAARLTHLLPPRPASTGGTPPLPLEARLDAVAAVLLDGLSYRRAGRAVGISKTEVGDSLDLLLGPLAALGYCQPDGSFITTLADLRCWLAEMAVSGETVLVDGLATRVQRPCGWGNQKVLYDAKRHTHTAQGVAVATVHGDLLWLDGGWPGSCHEQELITLAGLDGALDQVAQAGLRALVEQAIRHLGNAWALRRWRGLLYRTRDVFRAAGALVCLGRWLHRVPSATRDSASASSPCASSRRTRTSKSLMPRPNPRISIMPPCPTMATTCGSATSWSPTPPTPPRCCGPRSSSTSSATT